MTAKTIIVAFLSCLCGLWIQVAAASDSSSGDHAETYHQQALASLQDILNQETEIATKTRLNADFVPGMVTVLRGEHLELLGFRTVAEALGLVSGLRDGGAGAPLSVRGLSSSFLAGKVKFMLNGMALNSEVTGGWGDSGRIALDMPVEQVERIEVIRGPGGAMYGAWAYLGVVNVVIRQHENRLFGRTGSFGLRHGGVALSGSGLDNALKINLNLSGWQHGASGLETGPDLLAGTPNHGISSAPGLADDQERFSAAVLDFSFRDFSLQGAWSRLNSSSYFGLANALPPEDDGGEGDYDTLAFTAGWRRALSSTVDLEISLGWRRFTNDPADEYLYPAGFAIYDPLGNQLTPTYDDGWQVKPYFEEEAVDGAINLHWQGLASHLFFAALEYEKVLGVDHWTRTNVSPFTFMASPDMVLYDEEQSWLSPDPQRQVVSLVLQDQYEASERLTVTGGLRYDHYRWLGESFTPRLSVVYRASENHIFKGQFAEGFRPPTLIEMNFANNPISTGNPALEPETVQTWEAGYIYRATSLVGRLTLFHSELEELINVDGSGLYVNSGAARSQGGELEVDWEAAPELDVSASLSFADTRDEETGDQVAGAAEWLGTTALIYRTEQGAAALLYRFIGVSSRAEDDPRQEMESLHLWDLTLAKEDFPARGFALRTGIKNLFDHEVLAPSPYPGYEEDYPMPGRSWWAEILYSF